VEKDEIMVKLEELARDAKSEKVKLDALKELGMLHSLKSGMIESVEVIIRDVFTGEGFEGFGKTSKYGPGKGMRTKEEERQDEFMKRRLRREGTVLLRRIMKLLHLQHKDLAGRLGISVGVLKELLYGSNPLSQSRKEEIASIMGVKELYLFGEDYKNDTPTYAKLILHKREGLKREGLGKKVIGEKLVGEELGEVE